MDIYHMLETVVVSIILNIFINIFHFRGYIEKIVKSLVTDKFDAQKQAMSALEKRIDELREDLRDASLRHD